MERAAIAYALAVPRTKFSVKYASRDSPIALQFLNLNTAGR